MLHFFLKTRSQKENCQILTAPDQLKAWRRANRKMSWGIPEGEFKRICDAPHLTDKDRSDGFIGTLLSYGFGSDREGYSNVALSGKLAWEYACKRMKGKTWQCQYIDFNKEDHIRLRPAAPPRPKGFYYTKFHPGENSQDLTVTQVLKGIQSDTGCGPEGIQSVTITHPHFAKLMNQGKMAFMAFADYDIAPYGFNDFFDAMQMFCSNGTLGLGIGNVDQNYPIFGIPTLRFQPS